MTIQEQVKQLKEGLAQSLGGDSLAFKLLDVAICGHMTFEQQEKFIQDIANRGLYK